MILTFPDDPVSVWFFLGCSVKMGCEVFAVVKDSPRQRQCESILNWRLCLSAFTPLSWCILVLEGESVPFDLWTCFQRKPTDNTFSKLAPGHTERDTFYFASQSSNNTTGTATLNPN